MYDWDKKEEIYQNREHWEFPSDYGTHHYVVRKLFRDSLRSNLYVSINTIRNDIISLEGIDTPVLVAKLNILTYDMIEYDRNYFFSENRENSDYRPYFYNFNIYMDSRSNRHNFARLREMGDKWHKAHFVDKRFFPSEQDDNVYPGEIEQSASPIAIRKNCICIEDTEPESEVLNKIDRTYKFVYANSDIEVINHINMEFSNVEFDKAKVFRVGNANLIHICGMQGNQEFNIMYDVGMTRNGTTKYQGAIRKLKKIIPNAVILSHWDDDHIIGSAYAGDELFNCTWYAPQIDKPNAVGATRLAMFLFLRGKLVVAERKDAARELTTVRNGSSKISFYLGANRALDGITKENCGGIVIEIQNDKKESLFCGDVPYKAIKDVVWDKRTEGYDNLVVPHHGAEMSFHSIKGNRTKSVAVICAVNNEDENRPSHSHKEILKTNGYRVKITEKSCSKSYVELNLS